MIKLTSLVTIIIILVISSVVYSQTYSGPSTGSVDTGAVVNMTTGLSATGIMEIQNVRDVEYPKPVSLSYTGEMAPFTNYIYVNDKNANLPTDTEIGINLKLNSFPANTMTNSIPPDPVMAVGPNNVITCVNSEFSIWDKSGNLLKRVTASQWWSAVWPDEAGDPQVIYDHYENHWILCWMQVNDNVQTAGNLIAYSANEDPLGTWYMYRLDTKMHGTVSSSTWGDYPHIGYDDKAIFITTNCFAFEGGFKYAKIRIINKSELYSSNAGLLTYTDIWNITLPGNSSLPISIQPTVSYTPVNDTSYFAWNNSGSANFYVLYRIINPLTNPVLVGTNLPVPWYYPPPGGQQLGGGTVIENLSRMSSVPVYRDGKLFAVHAVRNSTSTASSSLKYFVVDVNTNSVIEQVEQGAAGYYYLFPSITVDKNQNIGITYSRSADDEYIGAYYSTRLASDPPGLSPSQVMVTGKGNYDVTFSGSQNRWGDYLSAGLDPANQYNIWFFSEYAARTNTWGTWLTEIRMKPFAGVSAYTATPSLDFGNIEVSFSSQRISAIIANYGEDDLIISDIPSSVGDFNLDTTLTFPITLSTYDSVAIPFTFSPTVTGDEEENYTIANNDTAFTGFTLSGHGYVINPALDKTMYATSGSSNDGNIILLNKETGEGTNIGSSLFTDILGLTINPMNNELYGVRSTTTELQVLRINSNGGDSYLLSSFSNLTNIVAIAFDTTGGAYVAKSSGEIYSLNVTDETFDSVTTAKIKIQAMTFDPVTNELWGTVRSSFSSGKDKIYKIDIESGDTTLVGSTGFNTTTNDLAFDEEGKLYGIKGSILQVSDLFSIDVNTGEGTIIGPTGVKGVTGLAYAETGVTEVKKPDNINLVPDDFILSQNYPNPFNPSTTIKYSIPVNSNIKLTVYNLLGQVVAVLANKDVSAGNYSVDWNGKDNGGLPVSSGIYFYELKAKGDNGADFSKIMKMVYLK